MERVSSKPISVLIADDEQIERRYLQRILSQVDTGLHVMAPVANGRQLLDHYAQHQPDVIIADICMPGITGLQALREIRQCDQRVILLINTAYPEFEYALEAIDIDIDAFLLKPADKQSITTAIQRGWSRRRVHHTTDELPYQPHMACLSQYFSALINQDVTIMVKLAQKLHAHFKQQAKTASGRYDFTSFRHTNDQLMNKTPRFARDAILLDNPAEIRLLESSMEDIDVGSIVDSFFGRLHYVLTHKEKENDDIIRQVERYLEENFRDPIRLHRLADRFYLTGPYLSTLFRQKNGQTINQFVRDLRMQACARLLVETNRPIKDIAFEIGYPQLSHFYQIFKKYYGVSPSDYRNEHISLEH